MPRKKSDHGHAQRAHHPYSPSGLQLKESCPKFVSVEGENEASIRGTAQHEATETLDLSKLTQDERYAVNHCLAVLEEARDSMPGCTELMEIRVSVDDLDTSSGFLDRALISADGKYAQVLDWKFGFGDIERAGNNLQGMAYAIGIRRLYPTLEHIRVRFITPRQAETETTHEFTAAELDECYRRIRAVVARAKKAKRARNFDMATPATSTCRFCGHLGKCPKAGGLLTEVGKHMPVAFVPPDAMLTAEDPEEIGRILDLLKYLDDFAKPIKNRFTEMAKAGVEIRGYSVASIASREVTNEEACATMVYHELVDKLGKSGEEALELAKGSYRFTLSAAESVLSDAAPRGEKRKVVEDFRNRLREAGAIMDGTPKVFLKRDAKLSAGATQTVKDLGIANTFDGGWM